MNPKDSGRLVLNHSTHVDGLIPVLERLILWQGIRTITPGVISRSRGHIPTLKLRVSVPIRGGYKAIARAGKTVQEVFVLTTLSKGELEQAIAASLK